MNRTLCSLVTSIALLSQFTYFQLMMIHIRRIFFWILSLLGALAIWYVVPESDKKKKRRKRRFYPIARGGKDRKLKHTFYYTSSLKFVLPIRMCEWFTTMYLYGIIFNRCNVDLFYMYCPRYDGLANEVLVLLDSWNPKNDNEYKWTKK